MAQIKPTCDLIPEPKVCRTIIRYEENLFQISNVSLLLRDRTETQTPESMSRLKSNEMKLHFFPTIHDHELCKNSKFLSLESGSGRLRRRRKFEILNDLTTLKPPKNRLRRLKTHMNYLREEYQLSECMN